MSPQQMLQQLATAGVLSEAEELKIAQFEQQKNFSVHWELRLMLYLGVVMLSTGLGLLVYKNIDTIGHSVIIGLIGLISAGCFFYAYRHRKPFSWQLVESDSPFADYALLLGCLTFLTMEGYLQYQYQFFGERYGLITFIPAVLFLFCAYFFDHRGALSMGLTAFGSWVGLTVTPLGVFSNDFSNFDIIITALLFGSVLVGIGWFSEKKDFKKHFTFTYLLLGGNLALIAAFTGMVAQNKLLFALPLAALCVFFIRYARQSQSFLFLLMGMVYGYIGLTYLMFSWMDSDLLFWTGQFYFVATAGFVIYFFLNYKKFLGVDTAGKKQAVGEKIEAK